MLVSESFPTWVPWRWHRLTYPGGRLILLDNADGSQDSGHSRHHHDNGLPPPHLYQRCTTIPVIGSMMAIGDQSPLLPGSP